MAGTDARLRALTRRIDRLSIAARKSHSALPPPHPEYVNDPVGYCRDILKVTLTPEQEEICRLLLTPPYRVLAPSAHNVGKSFLAACLVCWWFDTRDGVCLTTAPTDRQVKGVLWKEVRRLRRAAGLGGWVGPKIPRLERSPEVFAHGFTARDSVGFQGQHELQAFIVFDEAEGVSSEFWEAAPTMLPPGCPMLCIYNPARSDTQAAIEEQLGGWHVRRISAFNHPNITEELAKRPPPYPRAVRLDWLRDRLLRWATPVVEGTQKPSDVRFDGQWWRMGPIGEIRLLGRRPSQGVNSVWGEHAWEQAVTRTYDPKGAAQVGVDVARYGDDLTAFHVQRGGVSVFHQVAQGWSVVMVAARAAQLADEYSQYGEPVIAIDDCGVGGGVTDILLAEGWTVAPVNAGGSSPFPDEFPNLRSALWVGLAEEAQAGNVSFANLSGETLAQLKRELMSVTYIIDPRGRRVVEPKEMTKRKLRASPDSADAVMLAYCNVERGGIKYAGRVSA